MELIDLHAGFQRRIATEFGNVNNWSKYTDDQLVEGMYVQTECRMDPFIGRCDYLIGRELAYMGNGSHHSGCFRADYAVVKHRDLGLFITIRETRSDFGVSLKLLKQISTRTSIKVLHHVRIRNLANLEEAVGDLLRFYPAASWIERRIDALNVEKANAGSARAAFAFLDS